MSDLIRQFESKLSSASNQEDLIEFISFLPSLPPYVNYHIQLVYCPGDFENIILKSSSEKLNLSIINNKVHSFKYNLNKYNKRFSGSFFVQNSSIENLFCLHSLCYSADWNNFIRHFVNNEYPKVVIFYWKQKDLTKALKVLEESYRETHKLIVKELSLKEKRNIEFPNNEDIKKSYSDKYDSVREWTSKTLAQVLDEALERGQWFKKIRFQLFRILKDKISSIPIASCNITKYGSISFNHMYKSIVPILLKELEPPLGNTIKLFLNKGLKQRNYKPAKPLAIEYDRNIFDDKIRLANFKYLLEKYPNSSKAIFHANPYLHINVADFKEGSSFDLFISSPNKILIIPQIKTSVAALERIVSFIFDEFYEGTIVEMS